MFLTARHLVENGTVRAIGSTESTYVPVEKGEKSSSSVGRDGVRQPVHYLHNATMSPRCGPFFHHDDAVDVAVFGVGQLHPATPVIPLGGHLDDWLGESDFVLTEAVILGYPSIPKARGAHLIGSHDEVNAMNDRCDAPHVHFVISAMAQGDFSGAPVVGVGGYEYALGMVTRRLASDSDLTEPGYRAAIGVEPMYDCLAEHKMLPDCQAEGWDGLWST